MRSTALLFSTTIAYFLVSLGANPAVGQDSLNVAESYSSRPTPAPPLYRWEVGYELLPLLNGSTPLQIIVKKHSQRKTGQALRLRVGLNSYATISRNVRVVSVTLPNTNVPRTSDSFGGSLRFGTEKNILFGKLGLFYGIDLIAQHFKNLDESIDAANPNLTYESTSQNDNIGLSPMFGLKYRFTSRISLSLEATLNAIYNVQRTTNKTLSRNTQVQLLEQKGKVFYYYLTPLNFLYLSAYF